MWSAFYGETRSLTVCEADGVGRGRVVGRRRLVDSAAGVAPTVIHWNDALGRADCLVLRSKIKTTAVAIRIVQWMLEAE